VANVANLPVDNVLCTVRGPHFLVETVRPRLAHIAVLSLFSAGLALQSLHLGHDIFEDEHAECECVAIDRQEGVVHLLPVAFVAPRMEVAAAASVVVGFTRGPDVYYGARAPPVA
jgi:hypothetical protein